MFETRVTLFLALLYTCQVASGSSESTVKDANQLADGGSLVYPYYPSPEDQQEGRARKPFGGDRSDRFLYPPRSYYVQWANEEEWNDWNKLQ